jgi:hypothetical protein
MSNANTAASDGVKQVLNDDAQRAVNELFGIETQPEEPTPFEEWAKPHLMVLPSGRVIALKRVSVVDLIEQGGVPDYLTTIALQSAQGGVDPKTMSQDQLLEFVNLVNIIVCASACNPIVEQRPTRRESGKLVVDREFPKRGQHLWADELSWVDRRAVYDWGMGQANKLRPFRAKPQTALGAI